MIRLIIQAKGGDRDAMSRLIEKSEQMVYTNCLRLLKNPEEARDMAQEVYLTVFLKLDTLKKPEAFFEWVKVIKINKCKNKLKQGNPYFLLEDANGPAGSPFEEKDDGDPYAHIEDKRDQISPDKTLDTRETQELLINLIDDLPDAQRMVLILFYYDDYSIREIARLMEISEGTVKSRLAYGRLGLKKALEKEKKKGSILYGRVPASLLAYIAYFLKKTFPDHQDEAILPSIREAVLAALQESGAATGAGAASASTAGTASASSMVVSAADSLAVESTNAFISGGLSLKGLSLTALWATTWGKAAITTIVSAAIIGSVAGGIRLNARTKQPEPIPVETSEILQQENPEESAESLPEAETSIAVVAETNESAEQMVETAQPTESTETVLVTELTSETTETEPETESITSVEEPATTTEEASQTDINEETVAQLEQDLAQQQANMATVQENYDNAVSSYEDALASAEQGLSEAKLICENELSTWTESYNNLLLGYEGRELDDAGKQDAALHEEQIARWQSNYDFVMPATIEDVKAQTFPSDFSNVNTDGANLVEKEQQLAQWQTILDEQQALLNEAQAALDAANQ